MKKKKEKKKETTGSMSVAEVQLTSVAPLEAVSYGLNF